MKDNIYSRYSADGFTLLETIIVCAILAIIVGLSLPKISKTFRDMQLADACQNIVSLSNYAHQRAVVEQAIYRLNLDPSEKKYWITYQDNSTAQFIKSQDRLGDNYYLPQGLDLQSEATFINFYPDGRADNANFSLANQNGRIFDFVTQPNLGDVKLISK